MPQITHIITWCTSCFFLCVWSEHAPRNLSLKADEQKWIVFKFVLRPVVSSGAEAWTLTKKEE